MAVKPITNKQVVNKETINRAEQVTTRNLTSRAENRAHTVVPGPNASENYSITLKDIDSAVFNHVKNVMRPTLREANEQLRVPVMYGNEERWKAVRKRGVVRDRHGGLLLPLIMLKRSEITKDATRQHSFKHDITREQAYLTRNSLWSKKNQYDNFAVQTGKKPVIENIITGIPDHIDITYDFWLWTSYIEQMNVLIEDFVHQGNTYWGEGTDRKFYCQLEMLSDASEMSEGQERFIKTTFQLIVKSYLLPEYINSVVTNKISQVQKRLSPSKVVFGFEGDASDKQVGK